MSETKLEIGDVVQLKSGGPRMVIEVLKRDGRGETAVCCWMTSQENAKYSAEFYIETLKFYDMRRSI